MKKHNSIQPKSPRFLPQITWHYCKATLKYLLILPLITTATLCALCVISDPAWLAQQLNALGPQHITLPSFNTFNYLILTFMFIALIYVIDTVLFDTKNRLTARLAHIIQQLVAASLGAISLLSISCTIAGPVWTAQWINTQLLNITQSLSSWLGSSFPPPQTLTLPHWHILIYGLSTFILLLLIDAILPNPLNAPPINKPLRKPSQAGQKKQLGFNTQHTKKQKSSPSIEPSAPPFELFWPRPQQGLPYAYNPKVIPIGTGMAYPVD